MVAPKCRRLGALAELTHGAASLGVTGVVASAAAINAYLAVLTLAARKRSGSADRERPPRRRFAVLVPAHDEAQLIGRTVSELLAVDYPRDLFSVHVVADNCADDTAQIARASGAIVHERHDPANRGKGPALGWLVSRLRSVDDIDAFVLVDADSTMSPNFLTEMDLCLDEPRDAWQGYYSVRDAGSSPTAAVRQAALALRHYVRPLGRTALGGSCGLFGNGMVFRRHVLEERSFSAHLVEDAEFQLELLLDDKLVGFVPDAVVEAEMPDSLDASRTQNERWELGRIQLVRSFLPRLVRRLTAPETRHRAAVGDGIADLLVPPLSVLGAATAGTTLVAYAFRLVSPRRLDALNAALATTSAACLAVHVVVGLRRAGVPSSVYRSFAHVPRMALWKVGLWTKMLRRPDSVTWQRTQRNATDAEQRS